MKRILILSVIAAMTFSACATKTSSTPQPLPDSIEDNFDRTGVNTNPYEYFHVLETPIPAGYRPFYISHYGRHGSRSNWEGRTYGRILDKYTKAHDAGILTEEGEKAYETTKAVIELHNHMNGRLTPRGAREHRAIAQRMYLKYRSVFRREGEKVRAVSSVVPRCLISMAAFTGELLALDNSLDISWDTGEEFMKYCSSGDPDDLKKEAYAVIGEYAKKRQIDSVWFGTHIFQDMDQARGVVGSIADAAEETLEIAVICGSFDLDTHLFQDFNPEDLNHYCKLISLNLFLRQCNSAEFGDRRMAVPEVENLVDDIIAKADEAIAGGDVNVDLRFGHDYQLLAICSRIGIKGIGERLTAEEAYNNWPGWLYSPFAGNLQMVFLKNKAGNVLVKFFINEREATLLSLEGGPYYNWEDVKTAWKAI
jgi:hypothetical protein